MAALALNDTAGLKRRFAYTPAERLPFSGAEQFGGTGPQADQFSAAAIQRWPVSSTPLYLAGVKFPPRQKYLFKQTEQQQSTLANKIQLWPPVKSLLLATGLYGSGMLLHRLPVRLPADGMKTYLPSDWKVYARVLLGIASVQKINQAFQWTPAPWLAALEAVSIINPLAAGFSAKNIVQTAVMAPIVSGVVQTASLVQKKLSSPVEEKWDIPPAFTRLGLSLLFGLAALFAYPWINKKLALTGLMGAALKDQATKSTSAFASASFAATCARGCSPGSFICLSELADIVSGFTNSHQSQSAKNPLAINDFIAAPSTQKRARYA